MMVPQMSRGSTWIARRSIAGKATRRLRSLAGRFASPGYNGDALTTEIWGGDDLGRDARGDRYALFRVVNQDGAALIEHGRATVADRAA